MMLNITSVKTSSDGVWQGDNPLRYAFPLLIIQTALVISVSRLLSFFLKPLRQPKVIAEILGGILLGPSALGRHKQFTQWIFPTWSTPILESVASIGLLFFLFLVGLELDLTSIRHNGKRAFCIATSGILLPFVFGSGITFLLRETVVGADKVGFAQCFLFMGVSLSITAFPVLARILAELKLLTTRVGETAMAAAAFNDIAAWVLLALAVALADDSHKSPLVSIWVLTSGAGFVVFMVLAVRPAMYLVAQQCTDSGSNVEEGYICLTLAGVMLSGFITDLIGIHSIFGAFVFGLMIPKSGEFAGRLIRRIEDFVCGLLLPLYFASSGLKTDVNKIHGVKAWGLLAVVISTACTGKILGTFVMGMLCMIPARESLTLGLLMNTKGLVELIVLNIGKEKKVLNDEMFAIFVMMALVTTFMTTPMVIAVYKPARSISSIVYHRSLKESSSHYLQTLKSELRVVACVHGSQNSPSVMNLINSMQSPNTYSNMKLYILRLIELTERSSSIMMVHQACKNGVPCFKSSAVKANKVKKENKVKIRSSTAISPLSTMHEDICHVAEKKKAAIVILPIYKRWRREDNEEEVAHIGPGWEMVNQRVLTHAPCTMALLVDRGGIISIPKRVCVVFIGGPDNREAVELGGRMAAQPATKVTVIRFLMNADNENCIIGGPNIDIEKELDEMSLEEFKRRWEREVEYVEKATHNITQELLEIGQSTEYELVIVGRGKYPNTLAARILPCDDQDSKELGPVGGLLASYDHGVASSVLVVQKHELAKEDQGRAMSNQHLV
ncbi:cation/H(+) antiporter 20-like [Rutidosis leptorrhynchoides]|uniref:cation/H(+) antiporter 20-like n=1 Tax=Rutidosis leptorrhynchoides TaxID=125765 RepID=UPI003A98F428